MRRGMEEIQSPFFWLCTNKCGWNDEREALMLELELELERNLLLRLLSRLNESAASIAAISQNVPLKHEEAGAGSGAVPVPASGMMLT